MQYTKTAFEEGQMLLIDKPLQWTSFDVVQKLRGILKIRKIGHAGTLDPLATGLLIVCTGKSTKKINEYMAQVKEYIGSITLGATTPTYDLESEPENFSSTDGITDVQLNTATHQFTGEILQVPPAHSAIKINGKRVYELARQGKEVKLEPRKVTVYEFVVTKVEMPIVYFRIACSTGTYIRSIAHDYGQALGCGAHLSSLRRTKIGDFNASDAIPLDTLQQKVKEGYSING
jgi:tRNA pseudouridine55 synthase